MTFFSKRKNDDPRSFPVARVVVVILTVIVAIILLLQVASQKVDSIATPTLNEKEMFGTSVIQMATAIAQGTPRENIMDNSLLATMKAIDQSHDSVVDAYASSEFGSRLTVTAFV